MLFMLGQLHILYSLANAASNRQVCFTFGIHTKVVHARLALTLVSHNGLRAVQAGSYYAELLSCHHLGQH